MNLGRGLKIFLFDPFLYIKIPFNKDITTFTLYKPHWGSVIPTYPLIDSIPIILWARHIKIFTKKK